MNISPSLKFLQTSEPAYAEEGKIVKTMGENVDRSRTIKAKLFSQKELVSFSCPVLALMRLVGLMYIFLPRGREAPLFYYCSRKLCSSTFSALLHILSSAVPLKTDEQSQHYEEKQQPFGNGFENHRVVARCVLITHYNY
uniref:Uncharacterized protein n=1 Tax=Glossina pallidipes TaxID=7398 RepID=A0A1A9Z743_GLOPL